MIVEETSRLSGYPPSRNDVIEYLNKTLYVEDEDKPTRVISATVQSNVYWLFGQDFQLENYKDAYIHVMEALATRFGENQLDESKNFYRNESEIQSYAQHASHSILNGRYWIHTHSSTKQKFAQIRRACEVAGVVFGNKSGVLFPES